MGQASNAYASLFGLGGAIIGMMIPFWMDWVTFDTSINVASGSSSLTTGLVGPILIALTSAIIVGLVAMMIGMVLDGYSKK